MKKILIAAALIFTTGIISSCSNQGDNNKVAGHKSQLILMGEKKDLGTAD